MNKPRSFYTEANRDAWNEAAPLHARHNQEKLLKAFATPAMSVWTTMSIGRLASPVSRANRLSSFAATTARTCSR